ncbi:MAG: glycosyltransferase family 2 protein [Phycisphaerales bacterium]|nr:glycosyltransferase family 2 protein [Phycisphaerales bacterium]
MVRCPHLGTTSPASSLTGSGTHCEVPTLFAIVPVYNEPTTLSPCVARMASVVMPSGWLLRIIAVDDGSDAVTRSALADVARNHSSLIECIAHPNNWGKGAALATGFAHAIAVSRDAGDAVVIQDADLEYDPHDFGSIIAALKTAPDRVAVVGNRWHRGQVIRGLKGRLHMLVNRLLTLSSNALTGLSIKDMECCYKAMPVGVLREILPRLTEKRFGIEPQLVAALARARVPITEVPVSYAPRSRHDGKKIGLRDGLRALWVILKSRRAG